ncbi:S8 family serine peptidase [Halorubrum rutilum]
MILIMNSLSRSRLALVVVVVVVAVSVAAVAPVLSQEAERPENANISPPADTTTSAVETEVSDESQQYTVVATNSTAMDIEELEAYGTVGTQVETQVELTTTPDQISAVRNLSWVSEVHLAQSAEPADVSGPGAADTLGVSGLHEQGITGDNVTVGVIDGGFDPTDPAIAENVANTEQFAATGSTDHGTNAAATVVKTAPDAQLSLATIQTATDFAAALQYFREQDVDVVVAPLSFPGFDDDGDHPLTDDVDQTRADGILVINSAGNDRQRHWQGEYTDTDGDGLHEFDPADETACVPNCETVFSGSLQVNLHWDADGDDSSYRVYLYNPVREEYLVGSTTIISEPDERFERIRTNVPQQPIDLVVQHTGGPADDELEITVFGAPTIEDPVARSSVKPPADVPSVVSVAAYRRDNEQIASYSSVGPNDAEEDVVDVAGYTNVEVRNTVFTGTSAAAPQVAGVAALAADAGGPDVTADTLASALDTTAVDVGPSGRDTESGAGVVNATAVTAQLTENTTDSDATFQATRAIGENPTPGGNVTVTTDVTVGNGSANLGVSESFTPTVGGAEIEAVRIDGEPATPTDLTASAADETGVTTAIRATALSDGTNVTITYQVTAPETNGTAVTIAGTATNGPDTTIEIGGDTEFRTVTSPLDGTAGRYDTDGDGSITAAELGDAVTAYGQNNLSAAELGDVVTAYGQS